MLQEKNPVRRVIVFMPTEACLLGGASLKVLHIQADVPTVANRVQSITAAIRTNRAVEFRKQHPTHHPPRWVEQGWRKLERRAVPSRLLPVRVHDLH